MRPRHWAFSIVGAVVLGVFCAIAALTQPETGAKGRREAILALVISAAWVAPCVVIGRPNPGYSHIGSAN